MALVYHSASHEAPDPRVLFLAHQVQQLDFTFATIQSDYDTLREEHTKRCSAAVREALSALVKLVERVAKTDHRLVYWYEKRGSVKLMLRCVGVDKRTNAIVDTGTSMMKRDVKRVENKFVSTSGVFGEGLEAVQDLNTRVTSYSLKDLCPVQSGSAGIMSSFASELENVKTGLESKTTRRTVVEREIGDVSDNIEKTKTKSTNAMLASDTCSDVRRSSL
jgi:hypothetical protein